MTAIRMQIAALSHQGRVRENNEDAVFADTRSRIAVVCDGMGGHAGGHVASEMAVQIVSGGLRQLGGGDWSSEEKVIAAMQDAVFSANDHILARARVDPALHDMGTTLVACAFMADRVVTANVGDSRIYRIAEGQLVQVSEDHSLVAERVKEGLLDPDSDEAQMLANIVTRALGMDQITVDITVEDLQPGDTYVLCSDGLHDMVDDDEICRLVNQAATPQAACVALVDLANQRGGVDNVSVVVARAQ
jgi:serine/threonine protein phosphatase PrpC